MRRSAKFVRYLHRARHRLRGDSRAARCVILAAMIAVVWTVFPQSIHAQVELPQPDPSQPIVITAEHGSHWTEGAYEVWQLRGNCRIQQGVSRTTANEAMLWIDHAGPANGPRHKVIAYLEGSVAIEQMSSPIAAGSSEAYGPPTIAPTPLARLEDRNWFGRLYSVSTPEVRIANIEAEPKDKPAIYYRAMARRAPRPDALQQAQFETTVPGSPMATLGTRTWQVNGLGSAPVNFEAVRQPSGEVQVVVSGGVNIVVEGLNAAGLGGEIVDKIDVSADRMVIWYQSGQEPGVGQPVAQSSGEPLEFYMEGNIVFRQGDRIVQAKAMYYNALLRNGVILDAELLTPTPRMQGLVRLKTDVLRQFDRNHFLAENASVTTSRMGIPTYELKSRTVTLDDTQRQRTDLFTGAPIFNEFGQPEIEHQQLVTGNNNVVQVEGVPIFYWPIFAADLQNPPLYLKGATYRNDRVFGNQALIDLNPYQILGIRRPPAGTDWDISLDYLSLRGFGGGTMFEYDRAGMFGWPGRYFGFVDAWYIGDHGVDNLGLDRRTLTFPHPFRGRTLFRHRQELPNDWQFIAQFGQVTDRNFLEQYYEQEWDEQPDQVTRLDLYRTWDNMSLDLSASALVNPYFMQTQNLPRLDHYWLGQPLLEDTLTLYSHSNLGYLQQNLLDLPTDPTDFKQFRYLPYDANLRGEKLATRNEVDWPFQLGPVKIVPYALGEAADWGQDLNGDRLQRLYGQVGLRSSMPFWAVDPSVESTLWNVHGLAHKVVLDMDFSYTDANRDLGQLPIYDAIDDNAIQAFRRRLGFELYDDPVAAPTAFQVPLRYDERFFAVRRGAQDWVTGPTEIADDLTVFRLGARQRWQTKRGMPGQQRIIDWMTFDTNMEVFPKPQQNFDQAAGMFDYDYKWFIGDRLSLISFGGFDFFDQGQQYFTVGGFLNRPPRGSLYLGFNYFEGNIAADVITASYTYRLSPKWLSTFGTSFDIKQFSGNNSQSQGNIGQSFRLTRIGESFLFTVGMNVDASRDNVGFNVAIIPRFLSSSKMWGKNSVNVPPAGLFGLD
ncbi:MAG: hypothetical protein IT427_18240 [Pirellulales bacterium]|nr:hypothetical protein [Pirellulales bacterium]